MSQTNLANTRSELASTTGSQVLFVNLGFAMEAYDALPQEVRVALQNADWNIDPIGVLKACHSGAPPQAVVTAIDNQSRTMSAKLRRSIENARQRDSREALELLLDRYGLRNTPERTAT